MRLRALALVAALLPLGPLLVLLTVVPAQAAAAPVGLLVTVSGPSTGVAGGTGAFTVTVRNIGSDPAPDLRLTVSLDPPAAVRTASVGAANGWTCIAGPVSCFLPAGLAAGSAAPAVPLRLTYADDARGWLTVAAIAQQGAGSGALRLDRGSRTVLIAAPSGTPTATPTATPTTTPTPTSTPTATSSATPATPTATPTVPVSPAAVHPSQAVVPPPAPTRANTVPAPGRSRPAVTTATAVHTHAPVAAGTPVTGTGPTAAAVPAAPSPSATPSPTGQATAPPSSLPFAVQEAPPLASRSAQQRQPLILALFLADLLLIALASGVVVRWFRQA